MNVNTELPNLAVIDGDFLLYYCTYPDKIIEEDKVTLVPKTLEGVLRSADILISQILTAVDAEYYIAALTIGSFRYKINPNYKANRKHKLKPEYFKELKDYLLSKKGFILHYDLEADDIVNIIKRNIRGFNATIVSNDTDLLSLEGVHYNPIKRAFVTCLKDQAHSKFWEDMIKGQPGDNIKGIPGKGEAFVKKLFALKDIAVPHHQLVLSAYIAHFGEPRGIDEFYLNYKCLKILDQQPGFVIPEPNKLEITLPL